MLNEITALDARLHLVRIPSELDVPLTPRIRRILDTPEFQRLKRISQLGLVAQVYPGAMHTRFEHSLGVYRLAVLLMKRMSHDSRFAGMISEHHAEVFILAALLHDLGHYPFCHPVEDMRLPEVVPHEGAIERYLRNPEFLQCLREDWHCEPEEILAVLGKNAATPPERLLASMISGPVDIDKMDYLYRDSLHAGVPYGRNFDQERLLSALCLNAAGDGLAISSKGKTAAEMMVFARYVMFSEVYWHHAVRSATAMFQRLYFETRRCMSDAEAAEFHQKFSETTDARAISLLRKHLRGEKAFPLWTGLFGPRRMLYKQVAQFSVFEHPEIYRRFTRRRYVDLVAEAVRFSEKLANHLNHRIDPHEIILDAPPAEREIEFIVDIYDAKSRTYAPFGEVSPVVRALAMQQFDDTVKRVRLFCHPRLAAMLRDAEEDCRRLLQSEHVA